MKNAVFENILEERKVLECSKFNSQMSQVCCTSAVLIVDDNLFNIIPLEEMLKNNMRIQVDKALNGQQAVEMFKTNINKRCCQNRYKLVLMDLNMPIMDGYDATKKIIKIIG